MTTCPCRFHTVCEERKQKVQFGWLNHGMTPEQVFRTECPWYSGQLEAERYQFDDSAQPPKEAA